MGEWTVRRGTDTHINLAYPNASSPDAKYPLMRSSAARVLLHMPLTGVRGRTVLSAVLSGRARGAHPVQTVTVAPLDGAWAADTATWNDQPAIRSGSVSVTLPALADGERFEVPITAMVSGVAAGLANHGWRVSTSNTTGVRVHGFQAGLDAWKLTVATSDAPEEPTTLHPEAGSVGVSRWVVSTDFTDTGGSTEQSAIRVQVSPTADPATAWDSGDVPTAIPELDLATTTYPALASGASTRWRAQVRDAELWSGWSDWSEPVTYIPKPAFIWDNPSAGVLWDPSTTVSAHLATGVAQEWRVRITDGADRTRVRYDTGRRTGNGTSGFAHTLPLRNADDERIFAAADASYWVHAQMWDRTDRVRGGPTDPPYVEAWQLVVFNADGALTPVSSLHAGQIGDSPRVELTWTRAAAPDGWVVERGTTIAARLDPEDVSAGAGVYTWVDEDAEPNTWHTYKVRAVVNSVQSQAGPTFDVRAVVTGLWLTPPGGTDVVVDGRDVSGLRTADRRAVYRLPGAGYDVDIVTAFEGLSGAFEGSVDLRPDRPDVAAVRAQLEAVRLDPGQPVRLAFGTRNARVLIRGLSVTPAPDFTANNQRHLVVFACQQVGT